MPQKSEKKQHIYSLSFEELALEVIAWNFQKYRASQIWDGLYRQMWYQPDQFTNLPKAIRESLSNHSDFLRLSPQNTINSKDTLTEKTLFRLTDGNFIETVLMLYENRQTICVSTQSGCGMGCVFCASGQMGLKRNLSAGEIVEQTIFYARFLKLRGKQITNVVYMGMGEPFQNFDSVMKSIDILNDQNGFNLGQRRFTISTVGLIPIIDEFASLKRQINLAISLHAPDDHLRSQLIPINQKYGIDDLITACRRYTKETGRRISFEYALIQDINDSLDHAKALAKSLKGLLCHVNLIRLNPSDQYSGNPSSNDSTNLFRNEILRSGIPCSIRQRRGIEINAGCGQLAYRGIDQSSFKKQ